MTMKSNRHERRKNVKIGRVETMRVEDIMNLASMCAWDGCYAASNDADKEGWSKMVLYSGVTHTNFMDIDPRRMARDCVLCPEHAERLDGHVLKDIGGKLRHIAGNA